MISYIQNSETCYQGEEPNQVRFVCPRQNEPREFLYCCKINGNDTNLVNWIFNIAFITCITFIIKFSDLLCWQSFIEILPWWKSDWDGQWFLQLFRVSFQHFFHFLIVSEHFGTIRLRILQCESFPSDGTWWFWKPKIKIA